MKLDGIHILTLGVGIAIGFFILPMVIGWVTAAGNKG
jgi:hypothetical protein